MASQDETIEGLIGFVASHGGDKALRVEENLGEGFVRLRVAEAERRQAAHDIRCVEDVVIELLRNARDAGAQNIFVAISRDGTLRRIVVLDDGGGIPQALIEKVFEARVTSKLESVHVDRWGVHGRGMALFAIRENAEEAYVADTAPDMGSSFVVVCDVSEVRERNDQSSWPSLGVDEEGQRVITKGPRNIARTCCEFALEERDRCKVYLGSPAEIAATIRTQIRPRIDGSDLVFLSDLSEIPLLERYHVAADADELAHVAQKSGLKMSERTAQRILAGQIHPIRDALARISKQPANPRERTVDLLRDRRGLKIAKDDAEEFLRLVERDFDVLASRYYLTLKDRPHLRVSGTRISLTFDLASQD